MKQCASDAINYLMPETWNYKFKNRITGYFTITVISLLPFLGVYWAEVTIKASHNYYWLDHYLFGVAGPWVFGFMAWLYCYPHSFRLGVAITIVVSLGNEFFYDVIDHGENWDFFEQILHTISDISGLITSYVVYKLWIKKT